MDCDPVLETTAGAAQRVLSLRPGSPEAQLCPGCWTLLSGPGIRPLPFPSLRLADRVPVLALPSLTLQSEI